MLKRLDRNSLLRDTRRNSWIMTLSSRYFIIEGDSEFASRVCESCLRRRLRQELRITDRERWLDVATFCALVTAMLCACIGLWWLIAQSLTLMPAFQ